MRHGVRGVQGTRGMTAPRGDPGLGRAQRRRVDAAGPGPADLLRPDQAAGLEHLHMLDDCGQGHRERLAEFAYRRGSLAEPLHHEPPARVGQGPEDEIQIGGLVNHVLEYVSTAINIQVNT